MAVDQVMAADSSGQRDGEDSEPNPRIQSVILHLRARYGAVRILGIGDGAQPLCRALRHRGYQAVAIDPGEHGEERRFYPPFLNYGPGRGAAFDMAVSIESDASLNTPAALVAVATDQLAPGGVFVLAMPYGGYLKNLLFTLCDWWPLPFFTLWDGGYLQGWSRKCLTLLLEAQGFTVLEFIGVRGPSLQWESLVLLAKKTGPALPDDPDPVPDSLLHSRR